MTELDKIARTFLRMIVRGGEGSPEERAHAVHAVLYEAGFFVGVDAWETGTELIECLSGADETEALLWLHGLLSTMVRGRLEDEIPQVVARIESSLERREQEEHIDTTDYEALAAAEQQVRRLPYERKSLWAMIVNLIRSG